MKVRKLRTNYVINLLGAIVPLGVALVTVPIYVHHIGNARYGVLSIVWVLLGYLGFLDLGLSRAAANALARLRDAPREERARVLVTTLVLHLGLGLFGSFCFAVFGPFLLQHVLAVPDALKPEIARAFPWMVGLIPLALLAGAGIGTLESREHFLLANVLQVFGMSLGQIAPVIVAVAVSPSLAMVIPTAAVARALTVAVILLVIYRIEGPLSVASFDRVQAKKLLGYGGWITVSDVIVPFLVSLDQIVIGSIRGVAEVTHYAVPMNLVTRSQVFPGALARTLFPRLSSFAPADASVLASHALIALAYGYSVVCAPAIVVTPLFFRYWIGAEFSAIASPVAELLFFGAWINAIAFVPYVLLQSQGRPDITGWCHLAQLVPFIAVLWFLTSAFGIIGAAAAYIIRCAVDAFCMYWVSGMPKRDLLRSLLPLVFLLASAGVSVWLNPGLLAAISAALAIAIASAAAAVMVSADLREAAMTSFRSFRKLRPADFSAETADKGTRSLGDNLQ